MAQLAAQHRRDILRRMNRLGWGIGKLAEVARVNRPQLSRFLNRKDHNPTCQWLDRIYRALNRAESKVK